MARGRIKGRLLAFTWLSHGFRLALAWGLSGRAMHALSYR